MLGRRERRSGQRGEREFWMHFVEGHPVRLECVGPECVRFEQARSQPPRLGAHAAPGQLPARGVGRRVVRAVPHRPRRYREDGDAACSKRAPRQRVGRPPAVAEQPERHVDPCHAGEVKVAECRADPHPHPRAFPCSGRIEGDRGPAAFAGVHAGHDHGIRPTPAQPRLAWLIRGESASGRQSFSCVMPGSTSLNPSKKRVTWSLLRGVSGSLACSYILITRSARSAGTLSRETWPRTRKLPGASASRSAATMPYGSSSSLMKCMTASSVTATGLLKSRCALMTGSPRIAPGWRTSALTTTLRSASVSSALPW